MIIRYFYKCMHPYNSAVGRRTANTFVYFYLEHKELCSNKLLVTSRLGYAAPAAAVFGKFLCWVILPINLFFA
jgi:hypothetical protein